MAARPRCRQGVTVGATAGRKLGIDLAHRPRLRAGGRVLFDRPERAGDACDRGRARGPAGPVNKPTSAAASRLEFGVAGSRIKLAGVRRRKLPNTWSKPSALSPFHLRR